MSTLRMVSLVAHAWVVASHRYWSVARRGVPRGLREKGG